MTPKWNVVFSDLALKNLKRMDHQTAALILGFIEKNFRIVKTPVFWENHCWRITKGNGAIGLETIAFYV